jgi:hypothetical protein
VRGAEPSKVAMVVLATALVLVSCTSGGASAPHGNAAHVSRTVSPVTATGGRSSTPTLTCGDHIGTEPPVPGMRIVDRVVALPASPRLPALGTARTGAANHALRLFAKFGLSIRTGATFTLAVPRRLARVASIGWGSSAKPRRTVTVRSCRAGHARWLAYAGGYWVRHTMCLPLVVRTHGTRSVVHIGVGVGCPGQRPPTEPSQS